MEHRLKGSVVVSGEGHVAAFSGHERLRQLFAASCFFVDHVHLNDRIAILTFFDTLKQTGQATPVSFRLQHQGGVIDNCILTPGHIRPDGGLELAIAIETAGADILLPANTDRNRLHADVPPLAAIAHEMRTPLNAIIGFSDFLLHEVQTRFEHETQREYVSLIKKSGEHLLEMVTRVLGGTEHGASGQAGKSNIDSILRGCSAMMASLLRQRHMTFNTGEAGSRYVAASDIEVRQIVINLLANAIKYTGRDGSITLSTFIDTKDRIVISVTDNGIGISRRQLARIGVPFRRARNAIESSVEGNGLGLALVYNIVASYGGIVRIKSRQGKGTCVSVFLPAAGKGAILPDCRRQSGRTDNSPHLIYVTEMKNRDGMKDKTIENGKKKEIRKSA